MIVPWLLYGLAVSALLGMAAFLGERAVRLAGGPTRLVWATALLLAMILPVAAFALGDWIPGIGYALLPSDRPAAGVPGPWRLTESAAGADSIRALDALLAGLWGLATAGLLTRLGRARFRLRRERAGWRHAVVDSVPVLVSPRTGPATIGALRPEIVLPEAVEGLPVARRRMILRHELEHVGARDGLLTIASFGLVTLLPWNPILWWMHARLRHAQEIDCDRRVLSAGTSVREYVDLLVRSGCAVELGLAGGPGFAVRSSGLRRRVTEILRPVPRRRRARMLSAAIPGILAACLALLASPPGETGPPDGDGPGAQIVAADANVMLREFASRLRAAAGSGALDLASARVGIRQIEARLAAGGAPPAAIDEALRAAERLVRNHQRDRPESR